MSKPLHEELQYLAHAIEGDTFHFAVLQWKHFDQIRQTKDFLRMQFPERTAISVKIQEENYDSLMTKIYDLGSGIVFLNDFEKLLDNPELYVPFNQRRGKIARMPLSIIGFIPSGDKYLEQCATRIPDWWSVLTFLASPEPAVRQHDSATTFREPPRTTTLAGSIQKERLAEIERLNKRIAKTEINSENAGLLNKLYGQVLEICETAGLYQLGLDTANNWLKAAFNLEFEKVAPEEFSQILDRLGTFEEHLGHYDRAARLMEKALTLDMQKFGQDHSRVATRQNNLANVYKKLGQYEKARDLLEDALQSDLKNFGDQHPKVAVHQSNLANVYRNLGDYEKARDLLEVALASAVKNFGAQHPNVAVGQSNLANVYRNVGDYKKARDLLESAFESDLKNFGAQHPNVALSQSNLADVYRSLGDYEKARDLLEAALASDLKNFGAQHPNVAQSQSNLALVCSGLGDYEKARDLLEAALASDLKNFGAQHPVVAVRLLNLGAVFSAEGQKTKAKELFQKAYNLFKLRLGENHPETRNAKKWLESIE